ncbi:MAG: efflux RND transporter periplasmic adaptor subunit [Gammaproteobacteria bacterium]|nr:efflux RND transporter periplasmic adaptor subunit [Gammaproteobacteria bacterium]
MLHGLLKRRLIPLLVLFAGVLAGALIIVTGPSLEPQSVPPQVPVVKTLAATQQTVRLSVAAHGTVVPKSESDLVAEVSGRVVHVSDALVSGGFFARGDVLVAVERIDYEVADAQAKAQLAAARSDVIGARRAYARYDSLADARSGSEAEKDDALNRLLVAQAALEEATARKTRAERDLDRTRLTAPYDGRVRTERVDVGQFVNRGEAIATLYSTDYAEVRLPVLDRDLAHLPLTLARPPDADKPPVAVVLKAEFAGRQHTWGAEVVRTEGELDGQTRMVNVIAQVAAPYDPPNGSPLTVGMFVEAEILGREVANVVVLPRTALQANDQVYLIGADNRLEFRDVAILRATSDKVYIQGGIAEGELVSTSRLDAAVEGQLVRPVDEVHADTLPAEIGA